MSDLMTRFWAKVQKGDDCWIWSGATNRHGYGQIRIDGRNVAAHRLAWEFEHGPIPEGMNVLHSCDNPPCIRGAHLWLGTMADNSQDMASKGRWRNQFTDGQSNAHCVPGHQDFRVISGRRRCVLCDRQRKSRYKARQITKRPPRLCPVCSSAFPAFGKRRFCSDRCKWTTANRRRRAA